MSSIQLVYYNSLVINNIALVNASSYLIVKDIKNWILPKLVISQTRKEKSMINVESKLIEIFCHIENYAMSDLGGIEGGINYSQRVGSNFLIGRRLKYNVYRALFSGL